MRAGQSNESEARFGDATSIRRGRGEGTSCRSTGGITSSSGSGTPSRLRTSTSTRSASRRTAYAGPGDGRARPGLVRARAGRASASCSRRALREDHDIARHVAAATATASRTSRSPCPTRPRRTGRQCSAARAGRRRAARGSRTTSARSSSRAIATYGDTIHTFVNRCDYAGPFKPGYVATDRAPRRRASGSRRSTTSSATSSSAAWTSGSAFYERVFGMTEMIHFSDEDDLDRVLGADVEGDDRRHRARSSSRSTSRPRESARARSRSTSTSTAARARSTSR